MFALELLREVRPFRSHPLDNQSEKSIHHLPDVTPHGLRHAFASTAEDLSFTLPTIKALIGHAGSGITEGYINKLDSALIAAADRVSGHIMEMMQKD